MIDIFIDKIINDDCFEALKDIPDDSVDLIITSPPYAEQRKGLYNGVSEDKYVEWFCTLAKDLKRLLKPTGSFFLNIKEHREGGERSLYVKDLVIALKRQTSFKFVDEFCWVKSNVFPSSGQGYLKNGWEPVFQFIKGDLNKIVYEPLRCGTESKLLDLERGLTRKFNGAKNGLGRDRMKRFDKELSRPSNVITTPNVNLKGGKGHPAVFPLELVDFFIKIFSNEGGVVLDCFAGSGTTGVVCQRLNRHYILIEQNKEYCDIIQDRLQCDY